jgi:hypothetical protein
MLIFVKERGGEDAERAEPSTMETETCLPEKPPQICRRALKMNAHRR